MGYCPHKGTEFSGDGRHDHLFGLTLRQHSFVAGTQSKLGFPGDIAYLLRQTFLAFAQLPTNPGRKAVCPGGFHQNPAHMAIACFCNGAPFCFFATGVLRRHQTEIGHQFNGARKARHVSYLGNSCGGHNQGDTPEGLVSLYYRNHSPLGQKLLDLPRKALHTASAFSECVHIFLKDDLLGRMRHFDSGDPTQMRLAPVASPVEVVTVPEKKSQNALLGLFSANLASSLDRVRSRMASSSANGTKTADNSPARCRRASIWASR